MGGVTDVRTAADLMHESFSAVTAMDLDRLERVWDDHSVQVFIPLQLEVVGAPALRVFFAELFTAMPDLRFVPEAIHPVDEHTAIGQWWLMGRFSGGPFQGIEPTGRRMQLRGIDVMRFDEGHLRSNETYYDGLSFARQVGLLPPARSAADRAMLAAFNTRTRVRGAMQRRRGR
jgi:ketosteroid isomerase-like protein